MLSNGAAVVYSTINTSIYIDRLWDLAIDHGEKRVINGLVVVPPTLAVRAQCVM